jgi:hypothetical protein
VLLGPVVEAVPPQILGVGALGVTSRHRDEYGGDVAVSVHDDVGDLIGRRAGQQHQR